MSTLTYYRPLVPYEDVPGYVHGIVGIDPPRVQCDGCGLVVEGQRLGLTVLLADITFDLTSGHRRRLCRDCWADPASHSSGPSED